MSDERTLRVTEPAAVPWLSVVLGFGPMVPFVLGAIGVWLPDGSLRGLALTLTIIWGGSILTFLAGVRRGLSFRTPGGARATQIATMVALFCLGSLAITLSAFGMARSALVLETVGYATLIVLDPIAAANEEAPLFFRRLRPIQLPIAVVSLAAILLRITV